MAVPFRRKLGRRPVASTPSASAGPPSRRARGEGGQPPQEPRPWDGDPEGEDGGGDVPRRPGLLGRVLLWGSIIGLVLLAGAAAAGYGLVVRYSRDLPSVETLKTGYAPPQVTRVYARDETLLASLFSERRTVIPYEQVPDAAKLAFLAAEDAHFFEHEGLNYFGIARAVLANVRAGRMVQGGSTITQQVVKNVLLDSTRSLSRKFRELLLTRRLEQSLTKDEILWLYLNHIYLGHGRYGIEEASRYYFGKHAKELMLDEAAVLAGLVASPERYSPRKSPQLALKRRRFVLDQMLSKGFVVPELYEQVKERALRLAPAEEAESKLVPEVIELAKKAIERLAPRGTSRGGFSVYTTIDPMLQVKARDAVRANIDAYMARHKLAPPYKAPAKPGERFKGQPHRFRIYTGTVESVDDQAGTLEVRVGSWLGVVLLAEHARYNPKRLSPSHFAELGAELRVSFLEAPSGDDPGRAQLELGPQSALVALDARTREVLALVGNYEALAGGLDRATQMRRQPGSTFKGLLYSYGLHSRKLTPATVIPVTHAGHGVPADGPLTISVRTAVAESNNEAAMRAISRVGPRGLVAFAKELGIESELKPDRSLALGSYEVKPIELANAYVAFANGGRSGEPSFIKRVLGPDGKELPNETSAEERQVLAPEEAYLTTSLLRSVVTAGTGKAAQALGRDAAGKTGTTNDEKDAWFVGYTTDIVCVVWVGFDDARPLGRGESGARAALPAWIDFMKAAHEGRPATRFARPPGVLAVQIDPLTGLLPAPGQESVVTEEFLNGTEPSAFAQPDAGVQ